MNVNMSVLVLQAGVGVFSPRSFRSSSYADALQPYFSDADLEVLSCS
jgi:hypothetical protein